MVSNNTRCYSADFETIIGETTRIWAYSICEVGNEKNIYYGTNMKDFHDLLLKLSPCTIYYHNLAFDGNFLISYWLNAGYTWTNEKKPKKNEFTTLITDSNVFYMLTLNLGHGLIKIYDSFKKLPFSVSAIAKAFHLEEQKLSIDYVGYREENHELTEEEKNYITNDVTIVGKALQIQFNQGLTKMTIASDAFSNFKNTITYDRLFPVLPVEVDDYCRKAYRGGWVYANPKYINQPIENIEVFDVNSLYPSVMYFCTQPVGNPVYYEGEYQYDPEYPLYICQIETCFHLKENCLPTIQIKKGVFFKPTEYITDTDGLFILRVLI